MGVHIDRSINTGDGPYVFRINGVVHHRIGSLLPEPGNKPEYAQLYIYDTEHKVANRLAIFRNDESLGDLDPNIVQEIIKMLDTYNPLVRKFRMARDRLLSPNVPEISIKLIGPQGAHGERYNLHECFTVRMNKLLIYQVSSSWTDSVPRNFCRRILSLSVLPSLCIMKLGVSGRKIAPMVRIAAGSAAMDRDILHPHPALIFTTK